MYKIGQKVDISVTDNRADFDRACDGARITALLRFGIDDDGHSSEVEVYKRSTCGIKIEFKTYKQLGDMGGWQHVYLFEAWVEQYIEDEDDD